MRVELGLRGGMRGGEIGLQLSFFASEAFELGRCGRRREGGGGEAGDGGALAADCLIGA